MDYKAVRGTRDIFGIDLEIFNFIENIAKNIFVKNGFRELKTPIFENTDVFLRTIGEKTDIVSKEMYTFLDKGDRSITLRPEGTASIVRAVLENNLIFSNSDEKFFYSGPMFRYDRPQKGRYRQFYQIGAEIFSSKKNNLIDLRTIKIAIDLIKSMGITEYVVELNSVGCDECRKKYLDILYEYLKMVPKDSLCDNCNNKKETNLLRLFDCKSPNCREILASAPKITDYLCSSCKKDLYFLLDNLSDEKNVVLNKNLVRGLDYYTGIVFEFTTDLLGAQSAILAGGRYDKLVYFFSGKKNPAIGFAMGVDRILEILKLKFKNFSVPDKRVKLFFIPTNEELFLSQILSNVKFFKIFTDNDYIVDYETSFKNVKTNLKIANRLNFDFSIFIEENEKFTIKSMKTGNQEIYDKDYIKNLDNFRKILIFLEDNNVNK